MIRPYTPGSPPMAPVLAAALAMLLAASPVQARVWQVAITQIVEHPSLDAVHEGAVDALEAQGYSDGDNLTLNHESAQGNLGIASQIARKFVGDGADVIIAIATPSAQAVASATRRTPVVFAAVTDPVSARLVSSLEQPGGNITGVTDMLPLDRHVDMLLRVMPELKTLGTVYNPGEANAAALVEALEKELAGRGLTLHTAAAPRSAEVQGAARSLVGKVDAIYLTTDNTVISAAEAVIGVGERSDIPVFAADTATVARGAVAALGFNYYDLGRQTGNMVARILEGAEPATMAVETVDELALYVNPLAAGRMGITLPDSVIAEADRVIE